MKKLWLPIIFVLGLALLASFVSAMPQVTELSANPQNPIVGETFVITVSADSDVGIEGIGLFGRSSAYDDYFTCVETPCTKTFKITEMSEATYEYTALIREADGSRWFKTLGVTVLGAPRDDVTQDPVDPSTMKLKVNMDDEFFPGDAIEVKLTLENKAPVTAENVVIELTVDEMSDSDVKSDEFILRSGSERTRTMNFAIPFDANEGDYEMLISVSWEDKDGNKYLLETVEGFEVERKEHELILDELKFERAFACGGSALLRAKLFNAGSNDEDITIVITNSELNIAVIQQMHLKEGKEDTLSVPLSLPFDVEGLYLVNFEARYAGGSLVESAWLEITCEPEENVVSVISDPMSGFVTIQEPAQPDYGMIALLVVLIVVIAAPTFWLGKKLVSPYLRI